MKRISFMNWDCDVVLNAFQENDSICINLIGADTPKNLADDVFPGEPIARLSVCMPDIEVGEKQTLIRCGEETKGGLEALIKAGIVSEPISYFDMGFVKNGAALVDVLV